MAAASYAVPRPLLQASASQACQAVSRRSLFGDVALVAFLVTQGLDGAFTYVGVATFGATIEANPLIVWLMLHLGHGLALMSAKVLAALLGIALHLYRNHGAVA